jgi:hypothetical protein
MDAFSRIRLRILAASQVRPHEIADAARERRIEERLRSDGELRDPLMVGAIPDVEGHVLLDGTNRHRALRAIGLPHVLAQVLDYADEHDVQLRTWCHASGKPIEEILEGCRDLEGLALEELEPLSLHDALGSPNTLVVLAAQHSQFAVTRVGEHSVPRASQLCSVVGLYEENMVRVNCGPEDVEERSQRLDGVQQRTLIAFPRFSRSQVVTMAMRGTLIPAGITRHVIMSGRALRVNVPLEMLSDRNDLEAANAALQKHLRGLAPRLYREPTILFDD